MKKSKSKTKPNLFSNKKARLIVLLVCLLAAGGYLAYKYMRAGSSCDGLPKGGTKVACYAFSQVGNYENPVKSNRGPGIDFWNTQVGCSKGDMWCASFVSRMLYLGRSSRDINTCSTAKMVEQFKARHQVHNFNNGAYKLYQGDVLYRTRPTGGHVGIVWGYNNDGTFQTIEGNTKCGSNECVKIRNYNKDGSPKDSDNQSAGKWEKLLRW